MTSRRMRSLPQGPDHMEHKFLDPNGITFDIASTSYATERWGVSR